MIITDLDWCQPPELVCEVEAGCYGAQQLYLVAPVVGVGGRRVLGSLHLVPLHVVSPGQHPHLRPQAHTNIFTGIVFTSN